MEVMIKRQQQTKSDKHTGQIPQSTPSRYLLLGLCVSDLSWPLLIEVLIERERESCPVVLPDVLCVSLQFCAEAVTGHTRVYQHVFLCAFVCVKQYSLCSLL